MLSSKKGRVEEVQMIDLSVYTMEIVIMCEIGNLGMLAYAGGGWVLQFLSSSMKERVSD